MANPFDTTPVNAIQSLMLGGQAYDSVRKIGKEREQEDALREAGVFLQSGNFQGASEAFLRAGKTDTAISLLKMRQQQDASTQFGSELKGLFGGSSNATPPAIAGLIAPPSAAPQNSRPPVASSPKVWGDAEAVNEGLYDPQPQPVTRVAQTTIAPQSQPAARGGAINGVPLAQAAPVLMRASLDPNLPKEAQETARALLLKAMDNKPPESQQNYQFYRTQGGTEDFTTWDRKNRTAGATNVSTVEGQEAARTKAQITVDTDLAKEAAKQAIAAQRVLPLLDQVEKLANKTPGGWAGPVAANLAKAISAAGYEVPENLSNAEVLQSISQRLVPLVREPGPTSERELGVYLNAVPGLMQSQEGRLVVARMTREIAQRSIAIARVYRSNIGSPDLYEKLSALDKPIIPQEHRPLIERFASSQPQGGGGGQPGQSLRPQDFETEFRRRGMIQ